MAEAKSNDIEEFTCDEFRNDDDNEDEKEQELLKQKQNELNNDIIIEPKLEPSKIFQTFAGKIYDENEQIKQLNNDTINDERKYDKIYNSYNNNNVNSNFESPLQRYKRIKNDIIMYQNELNDMIKKIENDKTDSTKNIINNLKNNLTNLWKNIDDFKNNPKLKPLFDDNINNNIIPTVKSDYLIKKLQEFQANNIDNNNNNNETKSDTNTDNNVAVFKLYHNGSINGKSYKMNDLATRIAKLETIIGPTSENSKVGNMNLSIEYLHKRLELLSDETKLSTLVRKAATLKKSLQDFQRKGNNAHHENQITKTKEQRINKMFDMMERWDQAASQLPTIIQRLTTLKNLHQEAANTVSKVNELQNERKVIGDLLTNNKQLLTQVQSSLKDNAKTMQNNIALIEKRIDDLQQKMQNI